MSIPARPVPVPVPFTATAELAPPEPIGIHPHRLRSVASRPIVTVSAAVVLVLALRMPFVAEPAYPDEGGYLLTARQWASGAGSGPSGGVGGSRGGGLYGDLWVDRPPLLVLFWRAADAAGGIVTARLLGCLVVAALVIFAGWAGALLGGRGGAVAASFTAAGLASSPAMGARAVDGELLSIPWVMASVTFTLLAVRDVAAGSSRRPVRAANVWALLAGMAAAAALLTKQNFVDPIAFAVVLVAASKLSGGLSWRDATRLLAWGLAGLGAVTCAVVLWASTTQAGIPGLWYVLYGFRSDAAAVIFSHSLTAPVARLHTLGAAALVSGLVVVFAACAASARRICGVDSGTVSRLAAVAAMLLVGLTGVALGASYWVHYLVGLVPAAALAAGLLARCSPSTGGRRIQFWPAVATAGLVVYIVAAAVVAVLVAAVSSYQSRATENALVDALRTSAKPGDTVFISYGHANVVEEAGLSPAYPYLWSLPMRTLDPHLHGLVQTLSGPDAPTWVVRWDDIDSWGIDADSHVSAVLRQRYRPVDTVCGTDVLLRRDVQRTVSSVASSCAG